MDCTLGDVDLVAGFDHAAFSRDAHFQSTIYDGDQLVAGMDEVVPLAPRGVDKPLAGVAAALPVVGNDHLHDRQCKLSFA